jgi:alkylhydroperoxidase family enzyme
MSEQVVPLSELERDLGAPPHGWTAELADRGVAVFKDDLGRLAVDRSSARAIYAQHREQQEAAAAKRLELERRAVEADRAFRASLPPGLSAEQVPEGISAGMLLMLSDPERQGSRRQSVLEHALANGGSAVYHPINEDAT